MGAAEVEQFLSHLATAGKVSASTQNQALSSLLFHYKYVLQKDLPALSLPSLRAKEGKRLPNVLTKDEVHKVLLQMSCLPHIGDKHSILAFVFVVGRERERCVDD